MRALGRLQACVQCGHRQMDNVLARFAQGLWEEVGANVTLKYPELHDEWQCTRMSNKALHPQATCLLRSVARDGNLICPVALQWGKP